MALASSNESPRVGHDTPYSVIDKCNAFIFRVVSVATLFMVVVTFSIVILRYGFNSGWIALQESVMYLHSIVFMLGMAYTLRTDGHVRVDVLYRNWSVTRKAWVNLIGTVLFLMPLTLVVIYYSFSYVSESWRLLEASKEAGGLPLVFILKSLIIVMTVQLFLQGVSDVVRNARTIKHGEQG